MPSDCNIVQSDGIIIQRLSNFKTVKPFSIKIGYSICGMASFNSFFQCCGAKSVSLSQFVKDGHMNYWSGQSLSIKLESTLELAILQYTLGVRRNKFNTDLLAKGPNAAKRLARLQERVVDLRAFCKGEFSDLELLKKQPCFTEYN